MLICLVGIPSSFEVGGLFGNHVDTAWIFGEPEK